MLLIVAHHYVVNSGLSSRIVAAPMALRSLFLLLFGAWGKTGINCFVLITGYFMCTSRITAKKFVKLVLEIEFYKLIFWLIFWLSGYERFSISGLVYALLPITSLATGFSSCYLVFYLLIPFLNALLQSIGEKQHICLLLLLSFAYIVIGTLPKINVTMSYVSWFVVLYILAAYLRLYPKKLFANTRLWGWATLGMLLISAISVVGMTWLGVRLGRREMAFFYYFVSDSNKLFAVLLSLSGFLFFKNVRVPYSRLINTVAASAFGVLLIHANGDTMRRWLWRDVLDNVGAYSAPYLVIHAIGSVLVIFILCTAIDYLRLRFLEKPFFRLWDRQWERWVPKLREMEARIDARLHIGEQ